MKIDFTPTPDCAMTRIIDFAAPLGQKAGPGQWNDLDMRKHLPRATFLERSHAVIHSSDWVGVMVSVPLFHYVGVPHTLTGTVA